MNTTNRWQVVAATIRTCLEDVNMRQADLVRESGLSDATVRSFMSGRLRAQPTPHTLRKLEQALMWPAGAIERILAGEDPDEVLGGQVVTGPGVVTPTRTASIEARLTAVEDQVERLAQGLVPLAASTNRDAATEPDLIEQLRVLLPKLQALVDESPVRSATGPSA